MPNASTPLNDFGDRKLWEAGLEAIPAKEVEEANSAIAAALELIRSRCENAYRFVTEQVQIIYVRRTSDDFKMRSSSNRQWVGSILVCDPKDASILDLAEWIVHEAIHQWLYRIEKESGRFYVSESEPMNQVVSPWSQNTLFADSFVHGVFVWFGLTQFYKRLFEQTPRDIGLIQNLSTTLRGFQEFECFKRLEPEWENLSQGIRAELDQLKNAASSLQLN